VDTGEADPYDLRNMDALRRPGALRILCKEERFAKAAQPVYLLPDLPQIREYFASYYRFFIEKNGVSDTRISDRFRELYALYIRTTKAEMEKNPPQISFDQLPAGSYIVFFAPQIGQAPQGTTPSEQANAPLGDVFILRVKLAAAKTAALTLGEMDVPRLGDSEQRTRNVIFKDASLPPGSKEADVIHLQNGDKVLWAEGTVLHLPIVQPSPPPTPQKATEGSFALAAFNILGAVLLLPFFMLRSYCESRSKMGEPCL
jgi:hypothetical protein